jgi:hypothetical protein
MLIKGLDGKPARVHIGDSIEVSPAVAEQLKKERAAEARPEPKTLIA